MANTFFYTLKNQGVQHLREGCKTPLVYLPECHPSRRAAGLPPLVHFLECHPCRMTAGFSPLVHILEWSMQGRGPRWSLSGLYGRGRRELTLKRDVTLERLEGGGLKKGFRGDVALRIGEGGEASLVLRAGPVGGGARGKSSP